MKKTLVLGSLALLLATAACGQKPAETTTTTVPGAGSVTTTQQGETTKVQVDGPGGQTMTVDTTASGGATTVKVEGVPGVGSVDVKAGGEGGSVSVDTPAGSVDVQGDGEGGTVDVSAGGAAVNVQGGSGQSSFTATDKVDESAFGVPFYPGATVESGGQLDTSAADGKALKSAGAQLVSKDPIDKVVAFYSEKAKSARKMDSTVDGKRTVIFTPTDVTNGTTIVVEQDEAGTRITLAAQGG